MSENKIKGVEQVKNVKAQILDYLLEEGILRKKLPSRPKIDFGFEIAYPPDPRGMNPNTKLMVIIKPKEKDYIIIQIATQISEPHVKALNSLPEEKKFSFFILLKKALLLRNLMYNIDIRNYRYLISDQIFIEKSDKISKNDLFKSIKNVFNIALYANILLGEVCSGKIDKSIFEKGKGNSSDPSFSLYS